MEHLGHFRALGSGNDLSHTTACGELDAIVGKDKLRCLNVNVYLGGWAHTLVPRKKTLLQLGKIT